MSLKKFFLASLATVMALTLSLVLNFEGDVRPVNAAITDEPFRIVAVGDMTCGYGSTDPTDVCKADQVAALVASLNPDRFMALGDLQYEVGSLEEYQLFYDEIWGQFNSIVWPVVSNHDYLTSQAAGYRDYFNDATITGKYPYYRWKQTTTNGWLVLGLNSECSKIDCTSNGSQYKWIKSLVPSMPKCVIAAWHKPLVSSWDHTANWKLSAAWRALRSGKIEMVLNGHVHAYERFAKMNSNFATAFDGTRQFIVGVGGKDTYTDPPRGQELRSNSTITMENGVLVLDLYQGRFEWQFVTIDGRILDHGKDVCR